MSVARRLAMWMAFCVFCWSGAAAAAVPASWKNTSFAYDARDTPLAEALMDFARTFGVTLDIEGVTGVVNGRLRANSAEEYLDRLALEHHFLWFVYDDTLYVSPREAQSTVSLEVSEDAIPDLREALNQVGLLDTRFGWGELPDEGTVIVSGPQRYVDYISVLSERKRKGEDKLEIMVFPLRYALADDRTINYRGQSIVVPGVATMLSSLLEKGASGTISNASDAYGMTPGESLQAFASMREQTIERIQNQVDNRSQTPAQLNQRLQASRRGGSRVSADIRNNALLIRDDPDKAPMYRSLIERLDQPRNVIEIDAIILDIERSKLAELGINWRVGSGSTQATINASGADPFLAGGSSATVLIEDFNHFFARVRALESQGEASLIANPSILTIENQPAVIDFSETSFLSSIGERVATITPVTAGTSLQVIPRSIGEGTQRLVQLSLDIEDGSIERDDSGDAGTPRVNRGSISTQAVIRADRSIAAGGVVARNSMLTSAVPRVSCRCRPPSVPTASSSSRTRRGVAMPVVSAYVSDVAPAWRSRAASAATSSAAPAIDGTALGETNEHTSTWRTPASSNASISRTRSPTATGASACRPSRGPTSRMSTAIRQAGRRGGAR